MSIRQFDRSYQRRRGQKTAQLTTLTLRNHFAPRSPLALRSPHSEVRRGVILLVVMVLLAMFTMLGLTLVLVTAQGRLSALAAARAPTESEHSEQLLDNVLTQIVAGSTDPNSVIGGHSLMEDKDGLPTFYGQISQVNNINLPVIPLGTVQQNFGTGPALSGQLMQFTVTPTDISQNPTNSGVSGQQFFTLPQYSGAFCGQVITMLTGPAAGHSARVVGYYFDARNGQATLLPVQNNFFPPWAYLQATSFDGLVPQVGDQFMVNGRPFSGTGFGLDLTKFLSPTNPIPWVAPYTQPAYNPPTTPAPVRGPLLTAGIPTAGLTAGSYVLPYAYLPNHSKLKLMNGLTNYQPGGAGNYWDVAGPGGANEPYDAPDFQNMMLAMHAWFQPDTLHTLPNNGVVTVIPSLHRPELVAWYTQQSVVLNDQTLSLANPAMRRLVLMRPEPVDNFFTDSNNNGAWDFREPFVDMDGNQIWTKGEPFLDLNNDTTWTPGDTDYSGNHFNPITGPWYLDVSAADSQIVWRPDPNVIGGYDVDNDQDGQRDSIWVDVGLQAQKESDGKYYKYLAAVLCIDLDGKLNLNATGSLAQLDTFRYGTTNGVVNANVLNGPFAGNAGSVKVDSASYQRNLPVGQGYGPADVNPLNLFLRAQALTLNPQANAQLAYQIFLQGYNNPGVNQPLPPAPPVSPFVVSGRYGEVTRMTLPGYPYPGVYPAYSYPIGALPPVGLSFPQHWFNGPRPGWSQWYDAHLTQQLGATAAMPFDWVNDPVALTRFSDFRPNLLMPTLQSVTTPPFFFDFLSANVANHVPTAHGTPSDLHSRGFLARDISGRPYYACTAVLENLTAAPPVYPAGFPWQTTPGNWDGTMFDFAISQYLSPNNPSYPWLSEELVLNEVVDSPYEINLTQSADREGRNTGNSLNNVVGNDFSPIDEPLRPSELEGLLRSHEQNSTGAANSAGLVKRLVDQQTALLYADYIATGGASPPKPATTTPLASDPIRLSVTTESWDAPAPNIALTPRQIEDVIAYLTALWPNPTATHNLNINNLSVADLARARIFAENAGNPNFVLPSSADLALFGNLKNIQQNVATFPATPIWPLLSSDHILGMRLDVNRLLGNGMDDNGNGVIDEPNEATLETMRYPMGNPPKLSAGVGALPINQVTGTNTVVEWLDLNNDGFLSATVVDPQSGNPNILPPLPYDPTSADLRARQLLARHLYVTMMLLLDDRSIPGGAINPVIAAEIFNASGVPMTAWPYLPNYPYLAGSPPAMPPYVGTQARAQAAYVVAQWAVNVVDFRDRDSIMTPFEFDIYPFHADVPGSTATWNVDDIVGVITATGSSSADDSFGPSTAMPNGYRGLVWGCERPELLLTETIAFHDRGTADTNQAENFPAPNGTNVDNFVNQGIPPDKDFDQVRRPRGSLVVELLNATNPFDAPQRDLQYDSLLGAAQPWTLPDVNLNQGYGVNLAQVATTQTNASGPTYSPVWRLAIAYSPLDGQASPKYYPGAPGTMQAVDQRSPILPPSYIHRAAYFAPYQAQFVSAAGTMNEITSANSFFLDADVFAGAASAFLMLPPGQYALVGSAAPDLSQVGTGGPVVFKTFLGQNSAMNAINNNPVQIQFAYDQVLAPGMFGATAQLTNQTGVGLGPYALGYSAAAKTSASIKPVVGVPIQTNWLNGTAYVPHSSSSATSAGVTSTLRMSVSEPEYGYPVWPPQGGTVPPVLNDNQFYYNTSGAPVSAVSKFPNTPFDSGNSPYMPLGTKPNTYVAPDGSGAPTMTPGYTMVYLQRLANPLMSWDLNANPYITVDSMPVDLTAYSGEKNTATGATLNEPQYQPAQGSAAPTPGSIHSFDTRRRGYVANTTTTTQTVLQAQLVPNIWTPLPSISLAVPAYKPGATSGSVWGMNDGQGTLTGPMPMQTLGYVNTEYSAGAYWTAGTAPNVGGTLSASGATAYNYQGDPKQPMPWITWNNRPYVSQYELMLVPASGPSSLLSDYGMLGWQSSGISALANEYVPGNPQPLKPPVAQFEHLLNFFNSQQPLGAVGTNTYLPNLFRVFEVLHVPSLFAGTQDMMNPTLFLGDNAVPPGTGLPAGALTASHLFHPPFNWLSRHREPGKINLNTIFDPVVFQSLADDYPGWSTLWQNLVESRQGQNLTLNSVLPNPQTFWIWNAMGQATNPVYPTYFANPFRPDGAGALVPPTSLNPLTPYVSPGLMHPWRYPYPTDTVGSQNGVNATLFRSTGTSSFPTTSVVFPTTSALGPLALFDDTAFDANNSGVTYASTSALLTAPPTGTARNSARNNTLYRHAGQDPAFQYQMFERLGNTTTNRSNVYAIWITLGKFEVQPIAVSATNPDGYRLLRPANDANGNQEVQRGFYIYDRSIPVGFQRGQNTNIEKGILLERVLQ